MHNHFKVYDDIIDEIRIKNIRLIKLKEEWYNISGVRYDDAPKGGKQIDIADQLHNIVELEEDIKRRINYKNELRRIFENEINMVYNNNYRVILKLFYLDYCTISQIAFCLKISDSHCKKLKRRAINEFISKNRDKFI